jgi:hypothetical protein
MNFKRMIFLFAFSFFAVQPAFAQSEKAVVSNIQGLATLIRGGETLEVTPGLSCQKGDILKTGSDCTLDLAINDLAGCRVLASSECLIDNAKKESMQVKVNKGNVILNLEKLPAESTFQVETPTAVAAVRGTQFWGRVDLQQIENPVTTFAVREGSVRIFSKSFGESFTVNQGQAIDIPKTGEAPPVLRNALEGEMQAMEQASTIKTSA